MSAGLSELVIGGNSGGFLDWASLWTLDQEPRNFQKMVFLLHGKWTNSQGQVWYRQEVRAPCQKSVFSSTVFGQSDYKLCTRTFFGRILMGSNLVFSQLPFEYTGKEKVQKTIKRDDEIPLTILLVTFSRH